MSGHSADKDACRIHRGEWGDRYCTVHRVNWKCLCLGVNVCSTCDDHGVVASVTASAVDGAQ